IISLSNPSSSDITTPLSEAKKVLTDTKSNMETFNGWTQGTEFSELLLAQSTQLQSLMGLVNTSYTASDAKTFYNKTDFADNAAYVAQAISNQSTPVGLLANVGKHTSSFFDYLGENKGDILKNLLIDITTNGIEQTGLMIQRLAGLRLQQQGIPGPVGKNSFVMFDPSKRIGKWPLSNAMDKITKGARVANIGKWAGRAATGLAFAYSTYNDVANNGKTIGQAIAKNGASTAVGWGAAQVVGAGAAFFLGATPVGWAAVGVAAAGIAVGTAASIAFDWAYENNETVRNVVDGAGAYIDKGLDKAKEGLSNAGKAIGNAFSSGLSGLNPFG
ncbi:hypothetical protein AB3331_11090, partial [Streptococcus sp. H49]